ncbi:hypothetical protein CCACVL1_21411 [Corchorus capsularis]|uniref:Uncharacterized protein n=1 Tax=Corchorus capsularis TaxID=210143 RepID=A0A1R3H5X2_COCAP|nr:hypothetical protein CCACVL1_21411 [Corchorus capsularis]
MAPNLQSLVLTGCIKMVDIHPSIRLLRRLKLLDLRDCRSLRSLPTKFETLSLETLILSGCTNLKRLPDFTMAPNLKHLISVGCVKIVDVHPSIGLLRSLKILNLRDCKSLRSLPTKIGMESLEILILSGCSNLERLPAQMDGKMKCLVELYLDGTSIGDLPSLIGHLSGLVLLYLKDCRNLASLPSSINGLQCLKTLNLSGCSKLENLPESFQHVESLEELDLSETAVRKPPSFTFQFKNLKNLSFSGWSWKEPPSKLRPNLPSLFKVKQRASVNSMALTLHPMSGLSSLTELNISYCNLGEGAIPSDICCLSSLETLDVRGNNFISLPANLNQLSKLQYLRLLDCKELKSLPELLTCTKIQSLKGNYSMVPLFLNATTLNSIDHWAATGLANCHRLAENTDLVALLKKHLKASANALVGLDIALPGSEIPEWFSHQREGYSIKIPLPPNIWNDSQWIGVAFCCVFVNLDSLNCGSFIRGRNSWIIRRPWGINLRRVSVSKDHIWLYYWSRKICQESYDLFSLEDKCGETGNLPSRLEYLSDQESDLEFDMSWCCASSKKLLEKLKLVNLEGSMNLSRTPDFTMAPNLETLILECCVNLVDVHPSIGLLRRLKLLNLRGCKSLSSLPTKIGMKSLETLILSGCSNLEWLPDQIDGKMECLVELHLDGTGLGHLSSAIGHLSGLVLLNLKDCRNLGCLPSSINGLKCLKTLNLSGCSQLEHLPESLQQLESLEELDLSGTAIIKPPSFIFQFKNLKHLSFHGCKAPPTKLQPNRPCLGSMNCMALILPPLSGLSSLTQLNISYCNLYEGAIPSDICSLSSLKRLDLRGNNFFSLPANLDRLSNLDYLGLTDCMELKSLPELLTSTLVPISNDCSFPVGLFANARACNLMDWAPASIWLTNCYRLAENTNVLTLLKKHLKVFAKARETLDIILPGSQIPDWFSHQSNESSIKIPLPHHLQSNSKWIGVAFCCVFVDVVGIDCKAFVHGRKSHEINGYGLYFGHGSSVTKDHLWLRYWSRNKLYSFALEDKCGETGHIQSLKYPTDEESDEFEVAVEVEVELSRSLSRFKKVKKCGVRLVYEKDLEELEQLLQICNSTCADESKTGEVLVKRKRNIYEEEAEPRESDRIRGPERFLSYIMRKKEHN